MVNLEIFFKNPFSDPKLSAARLAKSGQVHVARSKQNNPGGKYDTLIADTEAKTNAFSAVLSSKHFLHSESEGATKTVDQCIADFITLARDSEKLIAYTFRNNPAAYEEFYPHGVTEYSNTNKTTATDLMTNMINACEKHNAELPESLRHDFAAIQDQYTAAREAQLGKVGAIKGKQDSAGETRSLLEDQLMDNLLTLAKDYRGQPEKCNTYFELSLLKPYRHKKRGNGEPTPPDGETDAYVLAILALSTAKAEFSIAAGETYVFYNPGEVTLSIYAALNESDPLPPAAIALAPGEEKTLTVEDLGPAGSTFLLVNNNNTVGGSIEISLT
jgi:hypothetical protein